MLENFLNVSAFWWLSIIPLVILLYFLKLKREEYTFPSTMLWQKVIEDMRVNSPFQKLKNNLLLYLQILLLLLIIFALARPFLEAKGMKGRNVIVLLDASASMKTLEGGQSRFDQAREQIYKMIDDLSPEDRMMILSFARKARIEQTFTQFKSQLRESLEKISPYETETSLPEALVIAEAMSQKATSPAIYIYTDGAISELSEVIQESQFSGMKVVLVGEKSSNVGIVAFDVRLNASQQSYQAFVRIQNFSNRAVEGILELSINGIPLEEDIRLLQLGSGDVDGVLFDNIPIKPGFLKVSFTLDQGEDLLALDNQAWLIFPSLKKTRLCLVSEGNFFLRKVLLPHDSNLKELRPQEYEAGLESKGFLNEFDVVIFDGYNPSQVPSGGGYLFFNCIPPLTGLASGGEISGQDERLRIIDQNNIHPIMRFVDLRKLNLGKIMQVDWPEDTVNLLESEKQYVIGLLHRENSYFNVIGFDIFQSDWPLRLSFPIFIANTIRWFKMIRNQNNILSGEVISVGVDEKEVELRIVKPDGSKYEITTSEDLLFTETNRLGIYQIYEKDQLTRQVAVNLLSLDESNILPAKEVKIEGENIASTEWKPMNQEIWRYLLLGGFFILMLEWYVYNRRSLTFWRRKVKL